MPSPVLKPATVTTETEGSGGMSSKAPSTATRPATAARVLAGAYTRTPSRSRKAWASIMCRGWGITSIAGVPSARIRDSVPSSTGTALKKRSPPSARRTMAILRRSPGIPGTSPSRAYRFSSSRSSGPCGGTVQGRGGFGTGAPVR